MTRLGFGLALFALANCIDGWKTAPWTYKIDGFSLTRTETISQFNNTKSLSFSGEASLVAINPEARSRPHIVHLRTKKTDVLTGTSTYVQEVLVENGIGKVKFFEGYYDRRPDEPSDSVKPPQYEFSIVGVGELRPGAVSKE